MIDDDIYKFHIDAYSPETIPMSRLAEYMLVLADLYGEKNSVHFSGLEGGSTSILSRVKREAAPKVRKHVSEGVTSETYKKLNDMLRNDNADARLFRGNDNVLTFPGRRQPKPPRVGPFTQGFEKDGVLVRIGGKDKSAHALLDDGEGNVWSFEVSRDLARDLAHHLYRPIRMIGTGRFFRDEEGQWQHNGLRASEFHLLSPDSLIDVVARIRNLPADTWNLGDDPIAMLQALRDEDRGVH